jgi:hypothetical protein
MAKKTKKSNIEKNAAKKAARKMNKKSKTKVDRSNISEDPPFSS